MRLKVYVSDADYSADVLVSSLEIRKEISEQMSTATVAFRLDSSRGQFAKYDTATYDNSTYGIDVRELYDIRIEDGTGVRHFAGQIKKVSYERKSKNLLIATCECSDYTSILDRTIVPSATFTGQSDRAIIQSLINTYAPQVSALTANIAILQASIGYFEVKDQSIRAALDELKVLTGAEWRVDYTAALKYFAPTAFTAPFGLSSAPDGTSTLGIDAVTTYNRDADKIINRCIVLGGYLPTGTEIRQVYEDPASIAELGLYQTTIIDRENILTTADALLRAQATVEENAWPLEGITLKTFADGLDVGQMLPVYHSSYGIDSSYLIRSLSLRQVKGTLTEYSLELGKRPPSTVRLLQTLEARTRSLTQPPTAAPATGTVTDPSIAPGGLSAGSIGTVNATSIIGLLDAGQIGAVSAASILGTVSADQIGSVYAGTIQGVIVSNQVADDLIDRLSMYSASMRPIPNLAAAPTLSNSNFPVGSFYYNTSNATFYKNVSNVWVASTQSAAVAGKLEYFNLGTIQAGSIIGLIAAGQIGSVNASAIVGTVSASQISTVNATSIQGTISAGQIGTVNTSSLVGTISATMISGLIAASQIGSVSAGAITGTIAAHQIDSVSADTITIGTLDDSQIASVSASKLTAGTIDASVINVTNINASNITGGTMSASRLTAGTISTGGGYVQISGGSVTVEGAFQTGLGGVFLSDTFGTVCGTDFSVAGGLTTSTVNASSVVCSTFSCSSAYSGSFPKAGGGTVFVSGGLITAVT